MAQSTAHFKRPAPSATEPRVKQDEVCSSSSHGGRFHRARTSPLQWWVRAAAIDLHRGVWYTSRFKVCAAAASWHVHCTNDWLMYSTAREILFLWASILWITHAISHYSMTVTSNILIEDWMKCCLNNWSGLNIGHLSNCRVECSSSAYSHLELMLLSEHRIVANTWWLNVHPSV